MWTFWDTSAVLPLVLEEPASVAARAAFDAARAGYAWDWLRVEAEAGLSRRGAGEEAWRDLDKLWNWFIWVELKTIFHPELCSRNRAWRLRPADAGHLYCFQQTAFVLPEIQFVCFDREILQAAANSGAHVWHGEAEK